MTEAVRRKERCGNCKWFDGDSASGPCRRHAPPPAPEPVLMLLEARPFKAGTKFTVPYGTVVADVTRDHYICELPQQEHDAEFRHPWVSEDDWCGEWSAASVDDWEAVKE